MLSGFSFNVLKTFTSWKISESNFFVKLIIFNFFVLGAVKGITGKYL